MMGKALFLYLMIATIAFRSSAAAEFPGKRSCSDIQNCGKCLNKSKFDCVWHVSDTFEGSCVESHQCDSLDGKCFEGQDGKKKYNKLVCGDTCGVHTGSGITECLDFDAMGKKKRQTKNSDCAWFVNDGPEKCIGSKRCREKKNRNGSCLILVEDPFIDCTDFDGLCTDCLNMGCSWINSGKECVDSCTLAPADLGCSTLPNQDNRKLLSFEDEASHMCYNFNLEDKNIDLCQKVEGGGCKTCVTTQLSIPNAMMYIEPPTCKWFPETDTCYPFDSGPFDSGPTFLGEGTDECKVDPIAYCSEFDGLCTDCLNMGCSWINSGKECIASCTLAPADLGCSTLPKQDDRKLLSFEDEASHMCFDFKLEDKNIDLCQKVEGGCERCVTTQLFNPPDMAYIWPPTCKWFPETDTCYPFDSGSNTTFLGEGTDKCKEPTIVIDDPIVIVDPKPEDPIVKPKPEDPIGIYQP